MQSLVILLLEHAQELIVFSAQVRMILDLVPVLDGRLFASHSCICMSFVSGAVLRWCTYSLLLRRHIMIVIRGTFVDGWRRVCRRLKLVLLKLVLRR